MLTWEEGRELADSTKIAFVLFPVQIPLLCWSLQLRSSQGEGGNALQGVTDVTSP